MRAVFLCAGLLALTALAFPPARAQSSSTARGSAPPQTAKRAQRPQAMAPVPFRAGEALTYDVAWSSYLVAGSAVSRVIERRPSYNSTAYYIVAEGRPIPLITRFYAVYYKMDALLDSFSLLSQRTSLYTEENTRKRYSSTLFNRPARKADFEYRADEDPIKEQIAVPAGVQDGLSTLYTLRTRTFKAGDRLSIPVMDEGMLYTVNVAVRAPEPITVPFGQMSAWNLGITILGPDNQPVGQNVGAWISTDNRRLPLKLQASLPVGDFALVLRSVQ
jgi:hypothetical protein